jgi:hypothetical protein
MFDLTLTTEQEQILRDQVIDLTQPGPVLRDFQTVLDFVGPEGVKAGGKYNLLPIEAIPELNERLSRPLRLKLKRPQLRSHPYLQGLHLLLRASGLSRVEGSGDKARLVVEPSMLGQWQGLNPAERYFNLLEAWLRTGQPEMIGERGRGYIGEYLTECLMTWQFVLARPTMFRSNPSPWMVRETCLFALTDLFGLMHVEHPRGSVQRWAPAGVQRVPFGDAVLTLLQERASPYSAAEDVAVEEEDEGSSEGVRLGAWQPLFQPYFPEWQRNLVPPAPVFREGVFVFRVSLGKVWRRIAVPADANLETLANFILDSVDFDNDHLYEFVYRDRLGATTRVVHHYGDEGPWADEVRVGDLPLNPGQSMVFHFDFGDDWRFDVRLERIEPPGSKIKAPKVLEKQGKAPRQYPDAEW